MDTGRKILNLRRDRNITQQDLARACHITPGALSKIESGINMPRANVIWRIARRLGVTVEYLLDDRMPYPYQGYDIRRQLLDRGEDPQEVITAEITREEKAFIDALRKLGQVPQEIAYAIPQLPIETLRLVHFLIHSSKLQDLGPQFQNRFEKLIAGRAPVGDTKSPRPLKKKSAAVGRPRGRKKKKS